jgi:RNA recognition motif-containing protein
VIILKPIRVTFQKNLKELDRSANIYVKNLHSEVTGKDLEEAFSKYGEVFSTKVAQEGARRTVHAGHRRHYFERIKNREGGLPS